MKSTLLREMEKEFADIIINSVEFANLNTAQSTIEVDTSRGRERPCLSLSKNNLMTSEELERVTHYGGPS